MSTVPNIFAARSGSIPLSELDENFASFQEDDGSTRVTFLQAGTGAVARTVESKERDIVSGLDFMTTAQKNDVRARTNTLDVRAACQAGIAMLIATFGGGGTLYCPAGLYGINSVASSDTSPNGLLIPYAAEDSSYDKGIRILGDGPDTEFKARDSNMVLIRNSRNHTTLENIKINGVSSANGVIGVGVVPENMLSGNGVIPPVYADQSRFSMMNCYVENCTEGLKFQPGPQVGGADSGCFFHNVTNCTFNLNTRGVWFAKNADWSTHPNFTTRAYFWNTKIQRGNCGYYVEVGQTIELHACCEELINSGSSPCATPTARHVSADAALVSFFGGYSEDTSPSTAYPANILGKNNHQSYGYYANYAFPSNWFTNIEVFGTPAFAAGNPTSWTPVVASSGGGAQGASTSTGYAYRDGYNINFIANISVAKGTLGAGNLTVTGFPGIALAAAGLQAVGVSGATVTLAANYASVEAYIAGATIALRKGSITGFAPGNLTLAECADPIVMRLQGTVIV